MTISNIAAAINAAHAGVEAAKRDGTRHAIECGRLLFQAKATVEHGGWDGWIREHCNFSPRTAQLYLRLFRTTEADPAKAQRVADLSLRQAVHLLADTKKPALTNDGQKQLSELLAAWSEANSITQRVFADHLLETGEINPEHHAKLLEEAKSREYAELLVRWIYNRGGRAITDKLMAFLEAGGELKQIGNSLR